MSYLQMKFRGILKNGFPVKCIDESPSGGKCWDIVVTSSKWCLLRKCLCVKYLCGNYGDS